MVEAESAGADISEAVRLGLDIRLMGFDGLVPALDLVQVAVEYARYPEHIPITAEVCTFSNR